MSIADITYTYNELYYKKSDKKIQQKSINKISEIVISKFNHEFLEFLEKRGIEAEKELKFLKKAIEPLNNKETKFNYKTFCLILTVIIFIQEENNVINNIIDDEFTGKEYEELVNNKSLKEKINKNKKAIEIISMKKFDDSNKRKYKRRKIENLKNEVRKSIKLENINKKRENRKRRFYEFLNKGIDKSYKVILYYTKFIEFKYRCIDISLANDFLRIIDMDYKKKKSIKEKIHNIVVKEFSEYKECESKGKELSNDEINVIIDSNYDYLKKEILRNLIKLNIKI